MANKWIVITTINEPTEAIIGYASLKNWEVVIIGDTKTPDPWHVNSSNVHFLAIDDQKKLLYKTATAMPEKSYMRKNIGYLYAMQRGAEIIVDTDDDNIPYDSWSRQWELKGACDIVSQKWVNTYTIYGAKNSWPRGIPLTSINSDNKFITTKDSIDNYKVGIIQALADGDPDVDAIYRLINNTPIYFEKRNRKLVLDQNSWTPINSQNTQFIKKFFPLLYLPSTVTFRSTDIIRGYVAQPILWNYGYNLAIAEAGVIQKRNPHDYLEDFRSEVPIFLNAETIAHTAHDAIKPNRSIAENMIAAYQALYEKEIVQKEEVDRLKAWVSDIEAISP